MLGWQLGVGNRAGHLGFAIRILELHKSVRLICTGPSPGEADNSMHLQRRRAQDCSAHPLRGFYVCVAPAYVLTSLPLAFGVRVSRSRRAHFLLPSYLSFTNDFIFLFCLHPKPLSCVCSAVLVCLETVDLQRFRIFVLFWHQVIECCPVVADLLLRRPILTEPALLSILGTYHIPQNCLQSSHATLALRAACMRIPPNCIYLQCSNPIHPCILEEVLKL